MSNARSKVKILANVGHISKVRMEVQLVSFYVQMYVVITCLCNLYYFYMIEGVSIVRNHDGHLRFESNCMKNGHSKYIFSEVEDECTLLFLNHLMRKIDMLT